MNIFRQKTIYPHRSSNRRGHMSIEVVLMTAVMLPLAFGIYFLGQMILVYIFEIISALVGWPYL